MSPRTVNEYHDEGSTSALTAMLIVLLVAAIVLALYFLWYAPSRQAMGPGDTDIRVTVPETKPDVDVNIPPPARDSGQGAGPRETQPEATPEPSMPDNGR